MAMPWEETRRQQLQRQQHHHQQQAMFRGCQQFSHRTHGRGYRPSHVRVLEQIVHVRSHAIPASVESAASPNLSSVSSEQWAVSCQLWAVSCEQWAVSSEQWEWAVRSESKQWAVICQLWAVCCEQWAVSSEQCAVLGSQWTISQQSSATREPWEFKSEQKWIVVYSRQWTGSGR